MSLNRQCAVLVGGKGSRLGLLTKDCPKPLLEVVGCPFLEHLLRRVVGSGFDDIILLAGYKADMIRDFAERTASTLNTRIRVVQEPEPAGTGGALHYARGLLADEFMLMNGDSLFQFNLKELAERCVDGEWIGKVALKRIDESARYGTVILQDDTIIEFVEKSKTSGRGLINAGVYWLRRDVLDYVGSPPCSMETEVFPLLVERGLLKGWVWDGNFIDIGVPGDLMRLRQDCAEVHF